MKNGFAIAAAVMVVGLALTGCSSSSDATATSPRPRASHSAEPGPTPRGDASGAAKDLTFARGGTLTGDPAWVGSIGGSWSLDAKSDPSQGVYIYANADTGTVAEYDQKKVSDAARPGDDEASTLAVFTAAGYTKDQLGTAGVELGPVATKAADAPLVEFYYTVGTSKDGSAKAVYARVFTEDDVLLTATFTAKSSAQLETDATTFIKSTAITTD